MNGEELTPEERRAFFEGERSSLRKYAYRLDGILMVSPTCTLKSALEKIDQAERGTKMVRDAGKKR